MKTITIRDLRLHWPAAEKALALEHELLITRDGLPVAKLVKVPPHKAKRNRWNPQKHKEWLKGFWVGKEVGLVDKYLGADRAEPKN